MINTANKNKLRKLLVDRTGCAAQHNGWPCNTCFHSISLDIDGDALHEMWLSTLLVRGDYANGKYFYKEPEIVIDEIELLINLLQN